MGCFCRHAPLSALSVLAAADVRLDLAAALALPAPGSPMLAAVSAWLSARWLPGPAFLPDPAWLDFEWAAPQIPPASLAVLLNLLMARQACIATLRLDPGLPSDLPKLARVIATLNLRLDDLRAMEAGLPPWENLLQLNAQAALVAQAAADGVFAASASSGNVAVSASAQLGLGVPIAPWRPVMAKVKLLAPLVAIGQMLSLDWSDPASVDRLALLVGQLARVTLPPLADLSLVLRLLGRLDAMTRLGFNPRLQGFLQVREAVQLRATQALALLPPGLQLQVQAGVVAGLPALPPNPALLLNAVTVQAAMQLRASVLARLRWQVPGFMDLPMLTVAMPVANLVGTLGKLGIDAVLQAPCDMACDAVSAAVAQATA